MRRVYLQVDRLPIYAFITASYPRGLTLDLSLDLLEVIKPPTGYMVEFSPLILSCHGCRRVRYMDLIICGFVFPLRGKVNKLQDKRSTGDDAGTTG